MGPSWYWMPEVFEKFYADFGKKSSDFYELKRLDPAFDVVFKGGEREGIPDNFDALCNWFEKQETGAGSKLRQFMDEAAYKYQVGIDELVYKPGLSWIEFADWKLATGVLRLQVFSSFSKHVRRYFKNEKLIALMEFPVLFLGAMPEDTPALYSLMNYAGLKLGTWYPMGGFGKIVSAFVSIACSQGAQMHLQAAVSKIVTDGKRATGLMVNGIEEHFEVIISGADYHHTETLLDVAYRNYSEDYWKHRTFAPSCLLYYIGLNKKISGLSHHTLFFDEPLHPHAIEIYKKPQWPKNPLFYVCCPSKTDSSVAPENAENIFLLMPIAPGLKDDESVREQYFQEMVRRIKQQTGEDISRHLVVKRSYCVSDFVHDYHAYGGNAYGLANTLFQTAVFKPKMINRKLPNLFYTGQLTVPGPGVPPAIISGKVVAQLVQQKLSS